MTTNRPSIPVSSIRNQKKYSLVSLVDSIGSDDGDQREETSSEALNGKKDRRDAHVVMDVESGNPTRQLHQCMSAVPALNCG